MVMDCVLFKEEDFPMIYAWWKEHNGDGFQLNLLPPTSYIVTMDGQPVAFFAMSGLQCAACYIGFPVINPFIERKDRDKALEYMIEATKIWALKTGHSLVYISIAGAKIVNRFKKAGFFDAGGNNYHMLYRVS
jgi:hypothetical protein